jgi:uncharacterized protein
LPESLGRTFCCLVRERSNRLKTTVRQIHGFDGTHWDTARIRRAREFGWFRQRDTRLIEAAHRERLEAEQRTRIAQRDESRRLHWKKCPSCGSDMASRKIARFSVEECVACGGIFLDRLQFDRLQKPGRSLLLTLFGRRKG